MKRFTALTLTSALFLAGCALRPNPIVADFNGDSVTIVTTAFADQNESREAALAEAMRICAKGPKKKAEYASTRVNSQTYEQSHLFLCLN